MIKVYQTKFGNEGNCFAACIASLFETQIDTIPFLNDYKDDWEEYLIALNCVLRKEFQVIMHCIEYEVWQEWFKSNYKDSYLIVIGDSNKKGFEHAVVYKNEKLYHNPNNRGSRIKNIKYVCFFVKLHL